jgi:aryl-alcohol dehydrogenase-like predicted oxidoreductase
MRYKLLGNSGLRVSELALGVMSFGTEWGWGSDKQESKKVFDTYVKAGGNFIDTANRYTEGTSEKYVGEFIKSEREHFVVATKYSLFMKKNDPNFCGNHRKNMVQALDASLKRLKTDYVDLYWLHAWDFTTPVEEVMRSLDDMVRAGKILYIGISDTPAWIVSQANTIANLRGWTPFVALQIQYNLIDRTPERDLLPMARQFDMAITPWGTLAAGVLTGKYNKNIKGAKGRIINRDNITPRKLKITAEVMKIAEHGGYTPAQVAMAWVKQQPGVIIPIIGASNNKQLKENLKCLDCQLTETQVNKLNKISAFELGFPHDFLNADFFKDIIYGGLYDQIDNHRK